MKTNRGSGLSTLVALLGCMALMGGVLALSSLIRWYNQLVEVNIQTTCSTELVDKTGRADYYTVTAPMPDGKMLRMALREPANQHVFRSGVCTIKDWESHFGVYVSLQDADGRSWGLPATSESDYDPREPWSFFH